MQPARDKENINRLDEIIEGASKLPVEKQELILAVAEGMVFTRKHLEKRSSGTGKKEPGSRFA